MAAARPPELDYRIRWMASDAHPGSHRSRIAGAGELFRGVVPLVEGRGSLRLDLRASARDPLERPWVREFSQRGRVPVVMAMDLSRSMRHEGQVPRLAAAARFARSLSAGAFRSGDPFGFIGCDRGVRRDWWQPPVVSRHAGERIARRLEALTEVRPDAGQSQRERGAEGLAQLAAWLPRRRSLVFLLSDLHIEPALFERCLRRLAAHEVIVLLMTDSAESRPPARWGFARLSDLESGRERLLFLRPGHAARMAQAEADRRDHARTIARRHHAALLVAHDGVDLAAVARHFLGVRAA